MQLRSDREFRMASVSDIHLGHRRNPTAKIIANLRAAFPDDATTAALHVIFIPGDVFDDLKYLSDSDVAEIDAWIYYMLRLCKKHDIELIVLEGTPSHDWKQSKRFVDINNNSGIGANLRYVQTLSIEYIERYGITVLCVPDEWDTPDNTLSQVHDLMKAKGLTQVDYAIMHGQFPHQLPEHVKAPRHDPEAYLQLVRYLIYIGHVHLFSIYKRRIISQGSFDRLSHGEEGPKGHVRATVRDVDDFDIEFIETVNAMKFITVGCVNLDLGETLEQIVRQVKDLPDGSHVRVEADSDNPILTNMEELIRRFPLLVWTKIARDVVQEEKAAVEEDTPFIPVAITPDNIHSLLMSRIVENEPSAEVLAAADTILREAMEHAV